ncbi:MAG: alkaline phosphatase family protein, partial [Acidobacteriota bacterium]
ADIDYLMPEFGGVTRNPQWLDLLRALSKPRRLLDTYEAQGTPLAWPMTDADRTGLAAWIIRTYRPHLMLLHIFGTDDAQHAYGPGTPQALASIEAADANVQRIIAAVADAGLQDRTDLVVLSDHGFLPIARQLQLNYAFKQDGLIETDDAGKVKRWEASFYSAGGSGFIILKNPDDTGMRERVGALLQKIAADPANGIRTIWNRDDLDKLGAEPRASVGIDMEDGFYSAVGHDVLMKPTPNRGGHGFSPSRTDLHASLVMRGPDVGNAGNLGTVRMSQIGPTIASWFEVSLSPRADLPLALPVRNPGGR